MGEYGGRSDSFTPGGLSFETGFCPHGVDANTYKAGSEMDLVPARVHDGTLSAFFKFTIFSVTMTHLYLFLFHRSGHV